MTQKGVISFPAPLYANVPIEPQFFQPSQFVITAITLGRTTIVTMANGTNAVVPNYVIGQQVRILIPSKYGSRGLNEQTGYVISLPSATQVEINIDSTGIDPFIPTPTFLPFQSKTPPQIVAIGDVNSGIVNNLGSMMTSTFIPGSFQNISPL